MNPAINLEDMGLILGITIGGKLALEGLQRLNPEQRDYALSLAKEFKPVILDELRSRTDAPCPEQKKAARTGWVAAICSCSFPTCTMLGNRKPLECRWNGKVA